MIKEGEELTLDKMHLLKDITKVCDVEILPWNYFAMEKWSMGVGSRYFRIVLVIKISRKMLKNLLCQSKQLSSLLKCST